MSDHFGTLCIKKIDQGLSCKNKQSNEWLFTVKHLLHYAKNYFRLAASISRLLSFYMTSSNALFLIGLETTSLRQNGHICVDSLILLKQFSQIKCPSEH